MKMAKLATPKITKERAKELQLAWAEFHDKWTAEEKKGKTPSISITKTVNAALNKMGYAEASHNEIFWIANDNGFYQAALQSQAALR